MADLIEEYEARVAALERLVDKQALELESLKRLCCEKRAQVRDPRPRGHLVAEGFRVMGSRAQAST